MFSPVLSPEGPVKITGHTVDTNTSSIFLSWTSPSGEVMSYRVKYGEMSRHTSAPSAVLSNLIPGTTYTITILAVAGGNITGEPYIFTAVTSKPNFLYLHITTHCAKAMEK